MICVDPCSRNLTVTTSLAHRIALIYFNKISVPSISFYLTTLSFKAAVVEPRENASRMGIVTINSVSTKVCLPICEQFLLFLFTTAVSLRSFNYWPTPHLRFALRIVEVSSHAEHHRNRQLLVEAGIHLEVECRCKSMKY